MNIFLFNSQIKTILQYGDEFIDKQISALPNGFAIRELCAAL